MVGHGLRPSDPVAAANRTAVAEYQQPTKSPTNADGSVDIYFAPEKPEGVADGNWIQTVAGKGFFPFYRFYGPLEAFNDQTWKPVEIQVVE
ncbi:MAG: DUF1214 domain-containing protein [Rhodobacteraceae bacterium]|nr:DUF1214 domain-containing protein [Paracoccaceae bacterium]